MICTRFEENHRDSMKLVEVRYHGYHHDSSQCVPIFIDHSVLVVRNNNVFGNCSVLSVYGSQV